MSKPDFLPPQRATRLLSTCSPSSPFKLTAVFTGSHSLTSVLAFYLVQHPHRAFSELPEHSTLALRHITGLYPDKASISFVENRFPAWWITVCCAIKKAWLLWRKTKSFVYYLNVFKVIAPRSHFQMDNIDTYPYNNISLFFVTSLCSQYAQYFPPGWKLQFKKYTYMYAYVCVFMYI